MLHYSRQPAETINGLPSFMEGSEVLDPATVDAFGDEWSRFDHFSEEDIRQVAAEYFDVFTEAELRQVESALDVGCGSGRWSRFLAPYVSELHAVDPSEACFVAQRNLSEFKHAHVARAAADNLPFAENSFDLVICLGVLHHIPDTKGALKAICKHIRSGGSLLLYLYYDLSDRSWAFRALHRMAEIKRWWISKLPHFWKTLFSDVIAVTVYLPFILLAKAVTVASERFGAQMPLSYYRDKSWHIIRNDARDRFGTPLEQRFSKEEIRTMLKNAGMHNVVFSEQAPYWHCKAQRR
jgi:SAM-dependent methyltransferase